MVIGEKKFDFNKHTYVMGILNVTPDSFSDGGKHQELEQAIRHAESMIEQGVDIIDIGGESTRPGHTQISDEEELRRVIPVIEELKRRCDVPLSLDTYKSEVARQGIDAGIDMINDIWGLQYDEKLADIIAKNKVACCLMHNRAQGKYKQLVKEVKADLKDSIQIAIQAGVKKKKIMIDPGIGFSKSYEQNLVLLRKLDKLQALGYPVLLGTSRKSVIGITLDLPAEERLEGTLATTVMGVMNGVGMVRVHDVAENKRVIAMTEAVLGRR